MVCAAQMLSCVHVCSKDILSVGNRRWCVSFYFVLFDFKFLARTFDFYFIKSFTFGYNLNFGIELATGLK